MPSAFSPNGDGKNETYGPSGTSINENGYEFRIIDRWGKQIFYTNDPYEHWNGKIQNTGDEIVAHGTYVYIIKLKDTSGTPYEYIGSFTLVR